MDVTTTAAALSTYGLYAVVAILLLVVMHLYREQSRLEDEMRKVLSCDGKDTAKLLAEATISIQQSAEALRQNSEAFLRFSETMTHSAEVLRQNSDAFRNFSETMTVMRAILDRYNK